MRKRSMQAALISILLIGLLIAGCQPKQSESNSSNPTEKEKTDQVEKTESEKEPEKDEQEVSVKGKIVIWEHVNSFEEPLQAIIEGFQEQYPEVEVDYEVKDSAAYYSLLSTAITSGDAPDLFWTNGTATEMMGDLVKNNALLDLTEIVDYSELSPDSLAIARIEDKMYAVPWMVFDTRANYYNKKIFAEQGWQIPQTFSEYEQLLDKQKQAGYIPISMSPNSSWPILFAYEPILSAYDHEYIEKLKDYSVKATDSPAVEALKKMKDWANKGYFGENYLGVTDTNAQILAFTTGDAAMTIAGSWEITTITNNNPDLELGAFQIPSEDGVRGMVGTFANGFSVYKDSPNMEAAQAFIKYCATIDAQSRWVKTLGAVSGSPKIESTNVTANEMSKVDKIYVSWQSILARYPKPEQSATNIWEENASKIFYEELTVQELMDKLATVMQ